MTDDLVERRGAAPHLWLFWLLIAAALVAGDFAMNHYHLLILAIAPAGIGLALALTRPASFAMRLEDEGLAVIDPDEQFIPYDRIEALCQSDERSSSDGSFPFVVVHGRGILNVPAGLTIPSGELFRLLRRKLPEDESIGPPPELREHQRAHEREFGDDRVFGFRTLPDPKPANTGRGLLICFVLLVTGFIWIAIGSEERNYDAWTGVGGLTVAGALIGMLVCALTASRRQRGAPTRDGGLVISPLGFALEQGPLCGQMRWDEVTDIEFRRPSQTVRIKFDGGEITIRDYYHEPMREIYHRLVDYWEGPEGDPLADSR
jgi:hypothetical protein